MGQFAYQYFQLASFDLRKGHPGIIGDHREEEGLCFAYLREQNGEVLRVHVKVNQPDAVCAQY